MTARRALSGPPEPLSRQDSFAERIVRWQLAAGRKDLPWQRDPSPYRVWVSEIMLQQTQVGSVIPYFERFLARFPDLAALAGADIDEVLSLWAGLGYYARARNLHACAKRLVDEYGARFPADVPSLSGLPGIGRSTAAAIVSLAFGQPAAILDGNVKRVLCRHFRITEPPDSPAALKRLWDLAERLLPATQAQAYSQGLMDLGATLCSRSSPACALCPVAGSCVARKEHLVDRLPTPRTRPAKAERQMSLLLIDDGARFLLERRPPAGIWGGLLSLPEADGSAPARLAAMGLTPVDPQRELPPVKHALTHFRLLIRPVYCRVQPAAFAGDHGLHWVAHDLAKSSGVPAPIGRLLARAAGGD